MCCLDLWNAGLMGAILVNGKMGDVCLVSRKVGLCVLSYSRETWVVSYLALWRDGLMLVILVYEKIVHEIDTLSESTTSMLL